MSPRSKKKQVKPHKRVPSPPNRKANQIPASSPRTLGGILAQIAASVWKAIVAISVVTTIVMSALYFLPSATVELGGLADSSKLLSVALTVRNDGTVTLTDVGISMGLCRTAVIANGAPINLVGDCHSTGKLRSQIALDIWQHHRLLPGEKYSISLLDLFKTIQVQEATAADISIVITYRPSFAPFWRDTKEFRIFGARDNGAPYEWRFKPLDED